jgi:hypothetical protein
VAQGGERGSVEDFSRCVPDFFHGEMDATHRLAPAVGAGHIRRLAGAGHRREGPVEHAHDLAERDFRWIASEEVATPLPFPALQNTVVPETEKNELEELGRNLLRSGEVGDSHWLASLVFRQAQECFDRVFGLLGQHVPFSVGLPRIYSRR